MAQGAKKDISSIDGSRITAEAATWKGTQYVLNGAGSVKGQGGDCSGSTWKIYGASLCPYDYRNTATFLDYVPMTDLFREVGATEEKQDGDILLWAHHIAIYSSFTSGAEKDDAITERTNEKGQKWTQHNDMWTAYHTGGPPYGPAVMKFFGQGQAPRVFRYQK